MANEMTTFREAYGVLQRHAETLRNQSEPNIDNLLSIVEESVSAYRVCKERIDAVEKALEQALINVGPDAIGRAAEDEGGARAVAAASPARAAPPTSRAHVQKPASGFDDMDDDIPF
ncbi:hypothetical protein FN976_11495 [Caenimonas sedimenti]|uniref:Uncharacterized protein n=1 Tax=Caenimonas sedimenti TaxID=2596921 RepID=A0A562ZT29_9BURK|nr:exodeoxyribonuclease VII small subunit [Caenimonas sedimenti]TWO71531.1 hypothetical protein FN976_11495 [Caenimonas sedimenti]